MCRSATRTSGRSKPPPDRRRSDPRPAGYPARNRAQEEPMAMDVNPIEVQKALKGVDYPASKDELVQMAESNDAPQEIVEELRSLEESEFDGPDRVQQALG